MFGLLKLPLLPLRGLIRLAEILDEQAQAQLRDPGVLRRQLEEITRAREAGKLTEEEASELERTLVAAFMRHRQGQLASHERITRLVAVLGVRRPERP